MGSLIDLTGQIFDRLTVISRTSTRIEPAGRKVPLWLCRCECGTEATIAGDALRSRNTKSCGCLKRDHPGPPSKEGHPTWLGDAISYSGAHARVFAVKGSASTHSCVDCRNQAEEWSYIGGCSRERISNAKKSRGFAYSPDPDRYVARCRSCHKLHDLRQEAA